MAKTICLTYHNSWRRHLNRSNALQATTMTVRRIFLFITVIVNLLISGLAQGYAALIFDCDGVLVDSEELKFKAWQTALKEQAIDFKENEYLPMVGYDSVHIAKAIALSKSLPFDQKAIIKRKDQVYDQLQKQGVTPLPDALSFLKLAIARKEELDLKIAIASSAPKAEILENLHQLGIDPNSFDYIISGKDDLKHIQDPEGVNKPKPYIYQVCAKALGVEPSQCLVFEDSQAGVTAAALAGMNVIAVPNSFTQHQDFSGALNIATFKDLDLYTLSSNA